MESSISPDRVANAIMMDNTFGGLYLIVEGKRDSRLYGKFIQKDNVRITEAFGFQKVLSALQILSDRGFLRKFGIIDSDFAAILNIQHNKENLFLTDYHDSEVMMIKSSSLDQLISTYCSKEKVERFEKKYGPIRDVIFKLGKEIGLLKLTNMIHDLGLVFKPADVDGNQIKYKDFIDESNLEFKGTKKLVESIISYSRSKMANMKPAEVIFEKLEQVGQVEYNIDHLVNGHDLSNILYLLFKKVFSSKNKMLQEYKAIEDSLFLAYEYEEFKKTILYHDILEFAIRQEILIFRM
jgi:hypothetical protein